MESPTAPHQSALSLHKQPPQPHHKSTPITHLAIASLLSLVANIALINLPGMAAKPALSDPQPKTEPFLIERQTAPTKGLPITVAQAVLQDATEDWGLPLNTGQIINAKPINWAYGCDRPTFPYPCDPIVVKGWQVTVEKGPQQWVYHTNTNGSLVQLYTRALQRQETQLPAKVKETVLKLASAHLRLPQSQLLLTQVQKQTWPDGCLGLPSPVERCMGVATPGWRVTVEGKPGQKQVYRTDNTGQRIRTEAIAGLPPRTDELPTQTATLILKNASTRLKVPMSQLYLLRAERQIWSNYCLDLPSPKQNCAQARLAGWRVTVEGAGRSLVYRIDDAVSQMRLEV